MVQQHGYRPLKKGDTVDLVAPGSGCTKQEYEASIQLIKQMGLIPNARQYEELISKEAQFCSNTDEYRFSHLKEALTSQASQAVWCISGGYGSPRLLEMLDKMDRPEQPKLFIGFSDITVLLNHMVDKWRWPCVYGPMLVQMAGGQLSAEAIERIKALVFGRVAKVEIEVTPLNSAAKCEGDVIEGMLIGGCISLMQTLLATPQDVSFKNRLVLFEDDRFESPRRVDRIFNHYVRSGALDEAKAIILGNFLEDSEDKKDKEELNVTLNNLIKELDKRDIPLVQNIRLGHAEDMVPVVLGSDATLSLGKKAHLSVCSAFEQ